MGRASGAAKEFEIGDVSRSGLDFLGDPYSEALEIVERLEKTSPALEELFDNLTLRQVLTGKSYPALQERATKALLNEHLWRKQFEPWGGLGEDGLMRYVHQVVGIGNSHSSFVVRASRSHYRSAVFSHTTLCGLQVNANSYPAAYRGDYGSMCSECQSALVKLPASHLLHAGLQMEWARGAKWLSDNLQGDMDRIKRGLKDFAATNLQDPSIQAARQITDSLHEQAIKLIAHDAISSLSRRTEIARRWFLFTPAAPAGSGGTAHETISLTYLGQMVDNAYPLEEEGQLGLDLDIEGLAEDLSETIWWEESLTDPLFKKAPTYSQFMFAGQVAGRYYPEACKAFFYFHFSPNRPHENRLLDIWKDKYGISF
jgi:hypothetical protein